MAKKLYDMNSKFANTSAPQLPEAAERRERPNPEPQSFSSGRARGQVSAPEKEEI